MDQRAEPPSWVPDSGRPRTGAAADLRNPEADEAAAGTPAAIPNPLFRKDVVFGRRTPLPPGRGTGGYSYDAGPGRRRPGGGPVLPAPRSPSRAGGTPGPAPAQPPAGAARTARAAGQRREGRNRTSEVLGNPARRGKRRARDLAARSPGTAAGARRVGRAPRRPPGRRQAPARRADLVVARLEPWSVMKFSFLMSLVAWVVLFVAVAFLYFVLSSLGVFTSIQHTLTSVTSSSGSSGANLGHWFSASRVLGYTMLLGAVNIVLITALSTVGAMIYNLVTHLGGGIEVTLRETD